MQKTSKNHRRLIIHLPPSSLWLTFCRDLKNRCLEEVKIAVALFLHKAIIVLFLCAYIFQWCTAALVAVPPMVLKPQKPLNRFHLKSCTLKSISLSLHQEEKSAVYSNRRPKVNTLPRGWKSRLMLYNHNREIRICEIKSNLSQCMLCNTIEGHQCRCMPHTN